MSAMRCFVELANDLNLVLGDGIGAGRLPPPVPCLVGAEERSGVQEKRMLLANESPTGLFVETG